VLASHLPPQGDPQGLARARERLLVPVKGIRAMYVWIVSRSNCRPASADERVSPMLIRVDLHGRETT
jgi:hypothetical protein